MNRKQNVHQKLSTLTALIAFTASTAFAAGGTPTPRANTAAPAGQTAPVCAPHDGPRGPRNGQPGQGGKDTTGMRMKAPASPTAVAPNGKTPPTLKNAPARPAPGAQVSDTQTPAQAPGDCGPGAGDGHRGGPDGQQAPATPAKAAARAQTELTRIDALLTKTTDAKARGYLTDARSLIVSGNMRAAHDLIRAAEALTGGQK